MKTSSSHITELKPDEIFVFGSNLKGQHGGGAAKLARQWGAKWGKGIGKSGQTYAIPTKKDYASTMLIEDIKPFVEQFIYHAKDYSELIFLVTEIGCGLAGYSPNDIAPLFKDALNIENIHLPQSFINILKNSQ